MKKKTLRINQTLFSRHIYKFHIKEDFPMAKKNNRNRQSPYRFNEAPIKLNNEEKTFAVAEDDDNDTLSFSDSSISESIENNEEENNSTDYDLQSSNEEKINEVDNIIIKDDEIEKPVETPVVTTVPDVETPVANSIAKMATERIKQENKNVVHTVKPKIVEPVKPKVNPEVKKVETNVKQTTAPVKKTREELLMDVINKANKNEKASVKPVIRKSQTYQIIFCYNPSPLQFNKITNQLRKINEFYEVDETAIVGRSFSTNESAIAEKKRLAGKGLRPTIRII